MKRTRSFLLIFLKYFVGVAAIVYILQKSNFSQADLKPLLRADIIFFLLASRISGYVLVSLRWQRILAEMNVRFSTAQILRYNLIAMAFSYILPGSVSADIGKAVLIGRQNQGDYKKIFASIFIDRLIGLAGLFLLFLVGLAISWQMDPAHFSLVRKVISFKTVVICLGFFVAAASLLLFLKPNRLLSLRQVDVGLKSAGAPFWLRILILSVLSHMAYIAFMIITAKALGLSQVHWLSSLLIYPLASLSLVVPLTPGATGVGQIVYQFFFELYSGYKANDGLILFTVNQLTELIFVFVGVALFVLNRKQRHATETDPVADNLSIPAT